MARRPRKPRAPRKPRQPKERKLAGTGSIVTNFRQASRASLKGATLHQTNRNPDGWSAIDIDRVHLNEVWIGSGMHILNDVNAYMKDVVEPTFKNSSGSPFCTIILGASPEYFRPNDEAPGDEDPERLAAWKNLTKTWIVETFGEDLVSAIYNGDETTPHVHLAICPTYLKKSRKPDRKKKGETDHEFAKRCEEWEREIGAKTLSWSSNNVLGQYNSFERLRRSYADAMKPLGLEYSLASFEPAQYPDPKHKKQHLEDLEAEQAANLAAIEDERAALDAERRKFEEEKAAFREHCDALIQDELRIAAENATRISEGIIATARQVAARTEAEAKRRAERDEADRVTAWASRLKKLEEDERRAKQTALNLEAQSSWFALLTANIGEAITRAFDLSFDTLVWSDEMPAAPSVDALFNQRNGSVTHGQRLEYLSLHGTDGERFTLSPSLIDLVKTVFGKIRDFAKRWKAQSAELIDARRSARDIEQRVQDTQQALSAARDQLACARKETAEAQELATRAYDDHAELSYEYTKLNQALEPVRPAYDALQDWLSDIQKVVPTDQDHHLAKQWIHDWLSSAPKGSEGIYVAALRLQDKSYQAELLKRVKHSVNPFPKCSADIRTRWKEIAALPVHQKQKIVIAVRAIDREQTVPCADQKEAEQALALEITKAREAKQNTSIPPLARQFLDLPEKAQKKIGEAIEAQDQYKKLITSSPGPTM